MRLPIPRLRGPRTQREQRVEDLRELAERGVGDRAGRVQDAGDAAQQVAEQVARALDGVDAQLDLVGADDEAEQVEVDRAEVEARIEQALPAGSGGSGSGSGGIWLALAVPLALATVAGSRTFSLVTFFLPSLPLNVPSV